MKYVIQFPDGRYVTGPADLSGNHSRLNLDSSVDKAQLFDSKVQAYAAIEQLQLAPSEPLPRVYPEPSTWSKVQADLRELAAADYDRAREMTRYLWKHEAGVCEGVARITEMKLGSTNAEVVMQLQPEAQQYVARCFASAIADAPNYTEMKFDLVADMPEGKQWITVTVQKSSGKTPHQLRMDAEAEVAQLRAQLAEATRSSVHGDPQTAQG